MTLSSHTITPPTPVTTPLIRGLHHVTAITQDAQANINFYTRTLALRLVKITVNYDDPSSYHLYYGDTLGRPGTALTFFVWPGGNSGRTGTGQVTETAFTIPVGSIDYWRNRLGALRVPALQSTTRFGLPALTFIDPDGLPLALVETANVDDTHLWPHTDVPAEYAIRGFHSVTLTEVSETHPASILVNQFGYREVARESNRIRYQLDSATVAGIVDVLTTPSRSLPGTGAGNVHHVAFRTPDDAHQSRWLENLHRLGRNVSPIMDRDYFHSIYFREPGGVLFEIATENPGFTLNETPANLGTKIQLPAWLEPHRAQIVAALPPVTLPPAYPNL